MYRDEFQARHNSATPADVEHMLTAVGADSLDALIEQTVPASIRLPKPQSLPSPLTEVELLREMRSLGAKNQLLRSYIGMGYYNTHTPPVILRNLIENPGWYTQYTPYQAEIAQGRLESLLNYQTMVIDLTGLEIANASLLDEATAAAEAMHVMFAARPASMKGATTLFVDAEVFPQTLDVLVTRAEPLGITITTGDYRTATFDDGTTFGAYIQYPSASGDVRDYTDFCTRAHAGGAMVCAGTDLMALTMLTPPGEWGADIAVGSAQRFGVPLGYGGPHAAFMAASESVKRIMPGRIIGVSVDAQGNTAYRMALQTREQHIRRDKATSNICTAQALLANVAAMYAVYHGPKGLRGIGERIHTLTCALASALASRSGGPVNSTWFDTLTLPVTSAESVHALAVQHGVNLRRIDDRHVGVSVDETTTMADIAELVSVCSGSACTLEEIDRLVREVRSPVPDTLRRTSAYLTHPVFNTYHSEHEMLRYLKRLENKDLSLAHSMQSTAIGWRT